MGIGYTLFDIMGNIITMPRKSRSLIPVNENKKVLPMYISRSMDYWNTMFSLFFSSFLCDPLSNCLLQNLQLIFYTPRAASIIFKISHLANSCTVLCLHLNSLDNKFFFKLQM